MCVGTNLAVFQYREEEFDIWGSFEGTRNAIIPEIIYTIRNTTTKLSNALKHKHLGVPRHFLKSCRFSTYTAYSSWGHQKTNYWGVFFRVSVVKGIPSFGSGSFLEETKRTELCFPNLNQVILADLNGRPGCVKVKLKKFKKYSVTCAAQAVVFIQKMWTFHPLNLEKFPPVLVDTSQ